MSEETAKQDDNLTDQKEIEQLPTKTATYLPFKQEMIYEIYKLLPLGYSNIHISKILNVHVTNVSKVRSYAKKADLGSQKKVSLASNVYEKALKSDDLAVSVPIAREVYKAADKMIHPPIQPVNTSNSPPIQINIPGFSNPDAGDHLESKVVESLERIQPDNESNMTVSDSEVEKVEPKDEGACLSMPDAEIVDSGGTEEVD